MIGFRLKKISRMAERNVSAMKKLGSLLKRSEITGQADPRTQRGSTGQVSSKTASEWLPTTVPELKKAPCLRPSTKRALTPKVEQSDRPISIKRLMVYLGRISILDRTRADWSTAQWKHIYNESLEDLADFPEWQIDLGFQHFKRGGSPWFPTPGQFINHIEAGRREWISG